MKTAQEIFDTVVVHLSKQNRRATKNGKCQYRAPDGLMCNFGVLIPDEAYTPDMENRGAIYVLEVYGAPLPGYLRQNSDLISALQGVHDNAYENEDGTIVRPMVARAFRTVAVIFSLDPAVVDREFPA